MISVGRQLREGREAQKLSLEAVSKATKIRLDRLREIEDDNFTKIPGVGYQREFVRTYAKYLKLDAVKLVKMFEEQTGVEAEDYGTLSEAAAAKPEMPTAKAGLLRPVMVYTMAGLVVFLVFAGLFGIQLYRIGALDWLIKPAPPQTAQVPAPATTNKVAAVKAPKPKQAPPAPAPAPEVKEKPVVPVPAMPTNTFLPTNTVVAPPAIPVPETVASTNTPPPTVVGTPAKGRILKIRAVDDCWVRVVVDGVTTEDDPGLIIKAGEESTWEGSLFKLEIFNPSLVVVTLDDQPVPRLSEGTEPKEATLP